MSDATDTLFDRFCDPSWRELEREWQQGLRTAQDCMARQVDALRATPEAIDDLMRTIAIDPQFPAFLDLCRRWHLRVIVLSDGLDRVIRNVLRGAGLDLAFFANRLQWLGADRWKLGFPFARGDCRASLGNCKCGHRRDWQRHALEVVVGDGKSDLCIAERAQVVLAKGQLASHCRTRNIPHQPIEDFSDAIAVFGSWLATNGRRSA
jgi:2-hydroxy-3-keto-5-methylthiopentenyl-1-phosphate phosphatase